MRREKTEDMLLNESVLSIINIIVPMNIQMYAL